MKKEPTEQTASTDADLFRQALDGVTPILPTNRISSPRPTPLIYPTKSIVCNKSLPNNWSDHSTTDVAPTSFLRNGINNMTLRKLRRGQWPIQDSIDLHGLSSDQARGLLANFMAQALSSNYRCINVIHGKG